MTRLKACFDGAVRPARSTYLRDPGLFDGEFLGSAARQGFVRRPVGVLSLDGCCNDELDHFLRFLSVAECRPDDVVGD